MILTSLKKIALFSLSFSLLFGMAASYALAANCYTDASGNLVCPDTTSTPNTTAARGLTCDPVTGVCAYTPLEPISGVSQDGTYSNFPQFLAAIFKVLFTIGALIAVAGLTYGGIQYMVSDVAHIKKDGLDRAKSAVYGMIILAGSWLILHTINPDLLNFSLTLKNAPAITQQTTSGTATTPTTAQVNAAKDKCEVSGSFHQNPDGTWSCN